VGIAIGAWSGAELSALATRPSAPFRPTPAPPDATVDEDADLVIVLTSFRAFELLYDGR
jgi:hypothetical protein